MSNKDIKKMEDLGWERMRLQLDLEMPQEKKKRRALIWWFSAACVTMIAVSTYFITLPNAVEDQSLFADETPMIIKKAQSEALKNESLAPSTESEISASSIVSTSSSTPSSIPSQTAVSQHQTKVTNTRKVPSSSKLNISTTRKENNKIDFYESASIIELKDNDISINPIVISEVEGSTYSTPRAGIQIETITAPNFTPYQVSNTILPKENEILKNTFTISERINENQKVVDVSTPVINEETIVKIKSSPDILPVLEELPSPIQPNKYTRIKHEIGLSTWAALGSQSEKYGIHYGVNFFIHRRFSLGLSSGYLYENSIITKVDGQFEQVKGNAFTTLDMSNIVKTQLHHNVSFEGVSAFYLIPKKFFLSGTLGYLKPLSPRKGTSRPITNAIGTDMGDKNEIYTARVSPSLGIGCDLKHFTLTTRYREVNNVYGESDRFIDFNLKYRF